MYVLSCEVYVTNDLKGDFVPFYYQDPRTAKTEVSDIVWMYPVVSESLCFSATWRPSRVPQMYRTCVIFGFPHHGNHGSSYKPPKTIGFPQHEPQTSRDSSCKSTTHRLFSIPGDFPMPENQRFFGIFAELKWGRGLFWPAQFLFTMFLAIISCFFWLT